MSQNRMVFERDYEFPSVIVWDALVDPELVVGWLAQANISPTLGGQYDLTWLHRPHLAPSLGRIVRIEPESLLRVETPGSSTMEFLLTEVRGGSRGRRVTLVVTIEPDARDVLPDQVRADWANNLDQLEDLLRGRPVDWEHWRRDRGPSWAQHLREEQNSTG